MKRNIIIYGLIAGAIVTILMAINVSMCINSGNYDGSILVGYATMLIAFSMIFVGIKNYRDKYNEGVISFGKAFKIGFFIALIASTIYVAGWLIEEQLFFPDFMDKYVAHELSKLKASGMSDAAIAAKTEELNQAKEMYKNPMIKILMTYAEILPVGLVVTLISSLILKRKTAKHNLVIN